MANQRELSLRIDDAEKDVFAAMRTIIEKYDLPFFLLEPIVDKLHRQIIDGKNNELKAARDREAAKSEKQEDPV